MNIDKYLNLDKAFVYAESPDEYLRIIDKISLKAYFLLKFMEQSEDANAILTVKSIMGLARTENDVQILKECMQELSDNKLISIRKTLKK